MAEVAGPYATDRTTPDSRDSDHRGARVRGGSRQAALELETSIPSASHELLDVAAGRIAILRTGEMGEEFIEVYGVELPR